MKTEKPVYTAICMLYYIYMAHLLLQKHTERGLFRPKLAAFLPIVYFIRRNCSLKNVIFLVASVLLHKILFKYLTVCELYIFLLLNPDCVSGQCPDVSGSSIGTLLSIVILSRSRRPEDRDRREVVCFPKTVLYS